MREQTPQRRQKVPKKEGQRQTEHIEGTQYLEVARKRACPAWASEVHVEMPRMTACVTKRRSGRPVDTSRI